MGTEIYIETLGQGPELVLLHGWGFHSGVFKPLAKRLSLHYRLTLVDLPGFGKSASMHASYNMEQMVERLLKKLPKHAIWIGWSLGGLIGLWIACFVPSRVRKLLTITSSPKFVAEENWPGISRQRLNDFCDSLKIDPYQTLIRFLILQNYNMSNIKTISKFIKKEFLDLKFDLDNNSTHRAISLENGLAFLCAQDLRSCLDKIKCPVLHILGEKDTIVPQSIAGKLQKIMPESQIKIILDAGHTPFLSHEAEFLQLVREFLR
jgi:pimeloyl-[acyl-carrier protein] methyl ester esterase